MKTYSVSLEISGPYAMWTRPDTGDCPVSYPAPTFSAVKGIFESILWGPAVRIIPTHVEICQPLIYHNYQTNYGGPLRKPKVMPGGGYQLMATALINVCYRLYANVYACGRSLHDRLPEGAKSWDKKTSSPGHAYREIFTRRLKRGQSFSIPFLGWKEFVPDYVGVFRNNTVVCLDINLTLPSMLREVFPKGYNSPLSFTYDQNVSIEKGVLRFPVSEEENHA